MTPLSEIGQIQETLSTAYGRHGRNIETWLDVAQDEIRLFDHDYGIELDPVRKSRLLHARSKAEVAKIIEDACREPTSLEILYYAQVGGPHVRGEA